MAATLHASDAKMSKLLAESAFNAVEQLFYVCATLRCAVFAILQKSV